jgi:putative phage-type endonuclease
MAPVLLLEPDKATPDNPQWHELRRAGVSASEIAAVLGISPWDSPFSLYWQKLEGWQTESNEDMDAGRRLEPVVAQWFADQMPGMEMAPAGLYADSERTWQLATPDRLVRLRSDPPGRAPWLPLECKAAGSWDGWGETGTDEIPTYYRAQNMQQMDVLGVRAGYVAVICGLRFRWYRINWDRRDAQLMREMGPRFLCRLAAGDQPDVDEHTATLAALKRLHPTVDDIDIQVPPEFAEGYRRARHLARRTAALVDRYDARARQILGTGRRLLVGKQLVVSRSVYDQSGDTAELMAIDDEWPTTDRLNPGRAKSYV